MLGHFTSLTYYESIQIKNEENKSKAKANQIHTEQELKEVKSKKPKPVNDKTDNVFNLQCSILECNGVSYIVILTLRGI